MFVGVHGFVMGAGGFKSGRGGVSDWGMGWLWLGWLWRGVEGNENVGLRVRAEGLGEWLRVSGYE